MHLNVLGEKSFITLYNVLLERITQKNHVYVKHIIKYLYYV